MARFRKPHTTKSPRGTMPLRSHLVELRNRLFIAATFIIAGAIGGWFLYEPVLEALIKPLTDLAAERESVVTPNFNSVAAAFDFKLKISVYLGVFLSSPMWIYQIYAFIIPGLTAKERRYAVGFMLVSVPLFVLGGYLAYTFLPIAVGFFLQFTPDGVANIIDAQVYLAFVTQVILAFGISFLIPVVMVACNFLGILSAQRLLKSWRWMVVLAFTFAAIATPTPDVVLMFLMATPMLGLFSIAIIIAWVNDRRRAKRRPSWESLDDNEPSEL